MNNCPARASLLKYTIVEHNCFKFTLKCQVNPDIPAEPAINDHLFYITDLLEPESASISSVVIVPYEALWLAYTSLIIRDYGVAQVGISIMKAWLTRLFTATNDFGVIVETVVVHPKAQVAVGAHIQWDHHKGIPIIKILEL